VSTTTSSSGCFIALEGVEGAGKTTQARLLVGWLEELDVPCTLAREPGGTAVGEAIRTVVQDRPELEIPAETELLLYVAARAAFVRHVVRPALERGEVVIADRFSWSTYAYQGYGRGLDLEQVKAVNAFATGDTVPDRVLVFDLPVGEGRARQAASGQDDDRMERSGNDFLGRVHAGYRALVESESNGRMVDASGPAEAVHARVREILRREFPETFSGSGVST